MMGIVSKKQITWERSSAATKEFGARREFRFQSSEFRVQSSEFRVQGIETSILPYKSAWARQDGRVEPTVALGRAATESVRIPARDVGASLPRDGTWW